MYKQIKNDLFSWGQLLSIISDTILVLSVILIGFIVLSMAMNSYPFNLTPAINSRVENRFFPSAFNSSLLYSWVIHLISLFVGGICVSVGIFTRLLKKKRREEYAFRLQRFVSFNIIAIVVSFLLIYIFGILFVTSIIDTFRECSDPATFYSPKYSDIC